MASVETRVVSLKFDNAQFLSGIKSTQAGLKGLKESLGQKISGQSLDGLADKVKNISFESLGQAAEGAGSKISIMAIAAGAALGNLASQVASSAIQMVKSFTIQPIIDGFKEYEQQLNSVQTILANTQSKGENISTVTAALDELNQYADLTKYNFSEMTHNIGMFTAAGVGLQDSVAAIKGISNLAAASGSSSQQASTAMYQLSQAISTGTVKLMDWNSVVNAGMGGEAFQEALKRTARHHGKAVDEAIAKNGSFRESLKEGWLDAEVMLETLSQLTGDLSDEQLRQQGYTEDQIASIQQFAKTAQDAATSYLTFSDVIGGTMEQLGSGWAGFWRIIIGDFEEAKALWTVVGNTIGDAISGAFGKINDIAQDFVNLGGKAAIVATIGNLFEIVAKPVKALGQAFGDIFSGNIAYTLDSIANAIEWVTAAFVLSDQNAEKLRQTFAGLFAVVDIAIWPFTQLFKLVWTLGAALFGLGQKAGSGAVSGILSLTATLAKGPKALSEWLDGIDLVGKVVDWLTPKLQAAGEWFSKLGEKIKASVSDKLSELGDKLGIIRDVFSTVFSGGVIGDFGEFGEKVRPVAESLHAAYLRLVEFGNELKGTVGAKIEDFKQKLQTIADIFRRVFAGEALEGLTPFAQKVIGVAEALRDAYEIASLFGAKIKESVGNTASAALDSMKTKLDSWSGFSLSSGDGESAVSSIPAPDTSAAEAAYERLSGKVSNVADTAQAKWQGFLDWWNGSVMPFFDRVAQKVTPVFDQIGLSIAKAFSNEAGQFDIMKVFEFITSGVLVASVYKFADALKSIGAPAEAFGGVIQSISDNIDAATKNVNAKTVLLFAASIAILAAAFWLLSTIDSDGVTNAAVAIGIITAALIYMMKTISNLSQELAKSKKDLGVGVGGGMIAAGAALLLLAGGVVLIAMAARMLSGLNEQEIDTAMQSIIMIVGLLSLAGKVLNGVTVNPGAGLALIGFAIALYIVGSSIEKLGKLDWETAKQGTIMAMGIMVSMGVLARLAGNMKATSILGFIGIALALQAAALVIIQLGLLPWPIAQQGMFMFGLVTAAMAVLSLTAQGLDIGAAASLFAMALALQSAAGVIVLLGLLPWQTVLQGVIALAAVLAMLVLATQGLKNAKAEAATLIGLAIGLNILGTTIGFLSTLGWEGIAIGLVAIAAGLGILIVAAFLAQKVAPGLVLLAATFGAFALIIVAFASAMTALALVLTVVAAVGAPAFAILAAGIIALAGTIPFIIEAVGMGFVRLLQIIEENKEPIASGIAAIIEILCTALINSIPSIVAAVSAVLDGLIVLLTTYIPILTQAAIDIIVGMLDAIGARAYEFSNSAITLILNFIAGIREKIPDVINEAFELILTLINGLADAVEEYGPKIRDAIKRLITAIGNVFTDSWQDLVDMGKDVIDGIVEGIKNFGHKIKDKVKEVANSAWEGFKSTLGISSPSRVFAQGGKWMILGAVRGVNAYSKQLVDATEDAADNAVDGFNRAIKAGLEEEFDRFDLTITPMLDTSLIDKGLANLNEVAAAVGARGAAELQSVPSNRYYPSQPENPGTQINYHQTINSPDPVSEAEVYRQTRNLISRVGVLREGTDRDSRYRGRTR